MAILELGTDTVQNIAKKAEVKRPSCYLTLDSLQNQGLVTKIEKQSTTLYSAEDPKIVLNKFKEKIANFQDLLPYFEAKFNKGSKPKIKFYEGKEELWHAYTKSLFPSKEIFFFGTDIPKLMKVWPEMLEHLTEKFIKTKKYKDYKEIVSSDQDSLEYAREYNSASRPIKAMPKDLPVFADGVITENKIFIVSLDNLFGVLIESEDLAKTFKNFFLLAWRAAKEIK